nr:zinc finger, CCHC-type [Tanacetum cinerariifolium]
MTGTKYYIKKFDEKNDFGLWQVRIKALLEQPGLNEALEELHVATIVAYDNGDDCSGDLEKLETVYMTKSLANRDLAGIDTAISDKDQALLLLTSLPSSYDNFVETLLYDQNTLKIEDVVATLNSRELHKITEAKVMMVKGCMYNHKKSQDFVKNEDHVSGSEAGGYESADVIMAMSVEEILDWIMDSGCSYHVTYMRDYFVDFEEYDGVIKNTLKGRKQLGEYQTGWKIKKGNILDSCNQRNMGFNESREYKKTFISSGVGFKNYHSARDREQHSAWELFSYREDSNKAAFAVVVVYKIYAHESLTFNDTVSCEVIFKWKTGLKEDMDARSDVYVLSNGCKKRSDHRNDYYWEYAPGMFIILSLYRLYGIFADVMLRSGLPRVCWIKQSEIYLNLLEGHSILPLDGSLSGDCDVEKNGKRSYIYVVGSHEYQMVCTRLDIASADVCRLDKLDCGLQTNAQVFVDFDYAMGRSITVMAAYMTLTKAANEAIWLKGLAIDSGFVLKIVAGIATGSLSKAIPGPRFQHRSKLLRIDID